MERLQTLYGTVNAYINKLPSNGEPQIHVSFVDNKNKLHVLLMQYYSAGWKFAEHEKHPAWVTSLEEQLNLLIKNVTISEYYLSKAS
jgi:hypothetical protein